MALVKDGTRVGEAVFLYSFYYVKKKKKELPKSCIWHDLVPLLVLPVARHRS